MPRLAVLPLLLAACGPTVQPSGGPADASGGPDSPPRPDGGDGCPAPATPAGPDVELAPAFAGLYTAYDLGPVPGVPNPLGGAMIMPGDEDTLLIAGGSERPDGAIYAIGVERNACHHIVGFVGTAQQVALAPYVDANLLRAPGDLLLYSEWPQYQLSQLPAGATGPARQTDLRTIGMDDAGDSGPGGLGFVPPNLPSAGELRMVTWPAGRWFHVATAPDGGLLTVSAATQSTTLPNEPGGFAYVPAGSPGFDQQTIIVAEWRAGDATLDRVAVYDADDAGDPVPTTRREFFTRFPRPWGAYFEPVTGDYLFLSWGAGVDRLFLVQGFVPPVVN
jgi:hypothetical protein